MMTEHDDKPLPPMSRAMLDQPMLSALFADLQRCAAITRVNVKCRSRQVEAPQNVTLDAALQSLTDGSAVAVQIHYDFEGASWIDTLRAVESGAELVRVKHK